MSRLADLIAELCPDGVEYQRLDELFATRNGYTPSRSDMSAWDSHDIPWFRMEDIRENGGILDRALTYVSSSAVKNGVLFPENSLLVATSATIGAHALITVPHLSNQRFTSLQLKDEYRKYFDYRFLYYYCFVLDAFCLEHVNVSSFPSVDMRAFRSFKFPFVPLAVQREIVRILDQFTTLEAELEAELEARRIQYADYQNRLLFPGNCNFLREVGTKVSLGDIASISKNRIAAEYLDETNFVGVDNLISDRRGRVDSQYSPASGSMTAFSKGDILIGNIRPYLRKVWFSDRDGGCSGDVVALTLKPEWKDRVSPRFLYYVVSSVRFFDFYQATARGGSIPRGDKKKLLFFSFIVPCKQEQEHIVMMLDRFEALINDIFSGLPAEIAARRAQYEHYRDRLLSFPEKVVSRSDAS